MLCGVVGMVLGLHFSSHTKYLLRFAVLLLSNSFLQPKSLITSFLQTEGFRRLSFSLGKFLVVC